MTEPWTPKKGDTVKLTVSKAWGPSAGVPINIRAATVSEVTKAGYVKVASRKLDKFERAGSGRYREWQPKSWGTRDYNVILEPVTAAEAATLPTSDNDGRAYAKSLKEAVA